MKHIGETIRKIRLMKGLSQEDISKGIISLSFYSRVERGKNNIIVDDFNKLLSKLNVSYDEFFFIYNEYKNSEKTEMVDKLMFYSWSKKFEKLKLIEKDLVEKYHSTSDIQYLHLSIHAYCASLNFDIEKINKQKIQPIIDYLFIVSGWSRYELSLFSNFMFAIPIDNVLLLANKVIKDLQRIWKLQQNDSDPIFLFLLNLSFFCIENNKIDDAEKFLSITRDKLEGKICLFERIFLKFYYGMLHIIKGNSSTGIAECQKCINTLETFDLIHYANILKKDLNRLLNMV